MPFDAGVMSAVVAKLREHAVGARIEKVYQPERDEIILNIRSKNGSKRLLLSACPGSSRVGFITSERENPQNPPMFCMLLRKHLTGGYITDIRQIGFDRTFEISLISSDELGYQSEKYLICEIMGTYSNIILLDKDRKIMSVLHPVGLGAANKRQVLVGFTYEKPDPQEGKINALDIESEEFMSKFREDISSGVSTAGDKYLISRYSGLSPLIAREIIYRASKSTSTPINQCDETALWFNFNHIVSAVKNEVYSPCIIFDKNGKVIEYSFCDIRQYGQGGIVKSFYDINELLDIFYSERDKNERIKRRGQDILRLLTNAQIRIQKKTELQLASLQDSKNLDVWKLYGDLITSNMYQLKKGMEKAILINYFDENMPEIEVDLDIRFTPAQNAQAYYKKYNKAKSALIMLEKQIAESKKENEYIESVFESLTKAETESDLNEIREELSLSGYGKKLESLSHLSANKKVKSKKTFTPMKFITSDGYEVLCGKNNLQNDYITTRIAEKNDIWFHVKNAPGSHVLLRCDGIDNDPPASTFTDCAMIAAYFSSEKEKPQTAVDYTKIRYVKKPSGSKPGFVIYEKNFTAYVTPQKEYVESLMLK